MKKMKKIDYYEIEAEEVNIFGNLREICLSDNILSQIPRSTKTLIDVACGDGYILHQVKKSKKHYVKFLCGLDLSLKRLLKTRKNFVESNLVRGSVFNLPFDNDSFDTVICSETLEHLENYKIALNELIRITEKNLIITVPNEENLTVEKCPKCNHHFYLNDHINSFGAEKLKETIEENSNAFVRRIVKFHTVFSYNNKTTKLPIFVRLFLDRTFSHLSKYFPFFKPNYLLLFVKKNKKRIV